MLTSYPISETAIACPRCQSQELTKRGIPRYGDPSRKKLYCKSCGKQFTERAIRSPRRYTEADYALWSELKQKGKTFKKIAALVSVPQGTVGDYFRRKRLAELKTLNVDLS